MGPPDDQPEGGRDRLASLVARVRDLGISTIRHAAGGTSAAISGVEAVVRGIAERLGLRTPEREPEPEPEEPPEPEPQEPPEPEREGLSRTVLRGVGAGGIGFVLTQVLTLGSFLVLARLATPEDFGELAAGTVLVNIAILVFGVESGMMTALIQRRDRLEEAAATAVISTFAAGILFTGLAYAASPLVGSFFDSARIGDVAAATSGMMLLRTIPVVPMALLQRRFNFVRRLVVEPLGVIAFGVTAVILTSKGMGVWGLVLGYYAQAVTDVILSWSLVRWWPKLRLASFQMWKELAGFARHVLAATAVKRVSDQAPSVLLGRYVGAAPLGQFRYGIRIASTPLGFSLAAGSYVLLPAFSRLAEESEPDRLRAAFVRALRWVGALGLLSGMLLLALGEPAATLVFGSVWTDAGYAAMALCLYPAAGAVVNIVTEAVAAYGRPNLQVRIHVVELIGSVAAMVALLGFELIGVAAGVSIGVGVAALYSLQQVSGMLRITARELAGTLAAPSAAAAVIAGALLVLDTQLVMAADRGTAVGLALLVAEAALGVGAYVLALHLTIREHTDELRRLISRARGREPSAEELDATGGIDTVPSP